MAGPLRRRTCSGASVNRTPPATRVAGLHQTIVLPLGRVILNEQRASGGGLTVNALHIIVSGADVVVASATAGMP